VTAEMAVMNREAVALAADSAATVGLPQGQKIYNTVNKLFMLSKYAPVGVMLYGNSHITGVPWETIVKEFRRELGDTKFPLLRQYAEALLAFLESKTTLFPLEQEAQEIHANAVGYYTQILREITKELEQLFAASSTVSNRRVQQVANKRIAEHLGHVEAAPDLRGYPSSYCSRLQRTFGSQLDAAIDGVFQNFPLGSMARNRLRRLVCLLMTKQLFPNVSSGIVIAGFGESEHFPNLIAYDTHSVLLGKVKQQVNSITTIDASTNAAICPFAQREMVDLFIEGVAPAYRQAIQVALEQFLNGLPSILALAMDATRWATHEDQIIAAIRQIVADFGEALDQFSQENHVDPILSAVAVLPKPALAEMAESLVNLTSFKRRVTMDPETVGGPIDVAVISKGDGFIWIRRKHYFDPKLNQNFFANYFR
jgi:hypothetical protein